MKSGKETASLRPEDAARMAEIHLVMEEKKAMVGVAQELLTLSDVDPNSKSIDRVTIGKKMMEFLGHLTNIGSFCDTSTKRLIYALDSGLVATIIEPYPITTATQLKVTMALAIGIQVDFTKRPFRVIGLSLKGFQAQAEALLKR